MNVTKEEAHIILKGAIKMAQQDNKIVDQESALLEKIMGASGIQPFEVDDFEAPIEEDMETLVEGLTSKGSKQAFLLTVAAMAKVDGDLDGEEKNWFASLCKKIDVGIINLDKLSLEAAEAMVLKVLSSGKALPTQGQQIHDMDLM